VLPAVVQHGTKNEYQKGSLNAYKAKAKKGEKEWCLGSFFTRGRKKNEKRAGIGVAMRGHTKMSRGEACFEERLRSKTHETGQIEGKRSADHGGGV